ncbi:MULTISPECIES: alpha/beta hydrolase family esterase [unclassified Marinobacter]|uniref:extracellular catalytic domain type 1 short-chain-length polyhydroxyalkanoate depolymerase n=1 Tax=unclassified Marinobacter TaxID=83889 RepID=UPI000BF98CA1|nr:MULTISPECIES: PHB depolymerase family esterase [unclassified Marinobacter]PFG09667.1 poly(hydroxyalkanoate) depolymerase family esterase [Marinobacter sp. LV10MA510-1]PFG51591.1 poly(hydroxyalkanoate) depolymerase family esterase [Marinobacter sp. LV10R520-4]
MSKSTDSHERLTTLDEFGTDPGSLQSYTYIPKNFPKNGPLVVVLHGSTQSAESYDSGSGWSALADECGIALLFPEQRKTNNAIKSFNWFKFGDSHRGGGEPLSIRHMIKQVVDDHPIDPSRVFITGMSSGGAMAAVMLATYPEVFAGGAIIAGLPYRSAVTLMEALVRMRGYGGPSDSKLDALVRGASTFEGPWPTISVWHGGSDLTVDNANADSIVRQWQKIHKVEGSPTREEEVDGFPRQVWCNADGREVIEKYIIGGMAHGTPIMAGGDEGLGEEGKFMLEVGISSTRHIANFWGLTQ